MTENPGSASGLAGCRGSRFQSSTFLRLLSLLSFAHLASTLGSPCGLRALDPLGGAPGLALAALMRGCDRPCVSHHALGEAELGLAGR